MSTRGIKKWALLLTLWLALQTAALRATDLLGPYGSSPITFDVDANGLVAATGTFGTGSLSLSGAGTRMFWYPGKAAFRAGGLEDGEMFSGQTSDWDDANIGYFSVAFGLDTKASGFGATASGVYSIASGGTSTAFGYNARATGAYSVALGISTTASGYFTTASGYFTTATAYNSFVLGRYNTGEGNSSSWVSTDPLFEVGNGTSGTHSDALLLKKNGDMIVEGKITASAFITAGNTVTGTDAVAFGLSTTASGAYSTVSGYYSEASGYSSVAMGWYARAIGSYATAFGQSTTANGNQSTALGFFTTTNGICSTAQGCQTTANGDCSASSGLYTTASAYDSFAMGRYNTGGGTANSWISTDPLFEVGNGTSSTAKSDALLLKKNGTMAFGHSVTASGTYSTATGDHTTATSYNSFVVGRYNLNGGTNGTAWVGTEPLFEVGNGTSGTPGDALLLKKNGELTVTTAKAANFIGSNSNTATGTNASALGEHNTATAYDSFVMGRYNTGGGNSGSWVQAGGGDPTDPLFEVGNGTSSTSPRDALLLDKNGNLTTSGVITTQPGGDIPMFAGS